MVKIKWEEIYDIAATLEETNEVIAVEKKNYYKLYYREFTAEAAKQGNDDFINNYLPLSNNPDKYLPPFKSKKIPGGYKLFRRKHGQKDTISDNSEKEIIFTCPYDQAKINKIEIIDAGNNDLLDLYVKSPVDPDLASQYGFPADTVLNQFGFDVAVNGAFYQDESNYDADVFAGFQIVFKYKNQTTSVKKVGFNLVYHEVTS